MVWASEYMEDLRGGQGGEGREEIYPGFYKNGLIHVPLKLLRTSQLGDHRYFRCVRW